MYIYIYIDRYIDIYLDLMKCFRMNLINNELISELNVRTVVGFNCWLCVTPLAIFKEHTSTAWSDP